MSDDIRAEITKQINRTREAMNNEIRTHIRSFYISIIAMMICLVLGFYVGSEHSDSTSKMIYHTQRKVDLIIKHLGIKNG
jgi:ribosomal protein S19